MKRRVISALSLMLLLSVLIIPVNAAVPDPNRVGSISASMTHDGKPVPGGYLTLFRVAELDLDGADYGYRYVDAYAECGVALEDLSSAATASALALYSIENRVQGNTRKIDNSGNINFFDLEPGLYLMVQFEAPEGYLPMDPFLVSVPNFENDTYVYDVNATPKLDLEPVTPPPTKPSVPTKPTGPSLPQTGQANWPVPVLACTGMLMVSIGWALYASSRKKYNEV